MLSGDRSVIGGTQALCKYNSLLYERFNRQVCDARAVKKFNKTAP